MKRIIGIVLSLILVLGALAACQNNGSNTSDSTNEMTQEQSESDETVAGESKETENTSAKRLSIVTTIFPQYDFARQIVGDKADLHMLLKPGAEFHFYEPTPQDIKTIQESDLFIYTGGENDTWVESILESMEGGGPETMKLVDLVDTYLEEIVEGMEDNHDHDHDHEDADAHEDHNHDHDHEDADAHEDHNHDHDHDHDDADAHDNHDHDHDHEDADAHDDHDHDHDHEDADAHDNHDHDHDHDDDHAGHDHSHTIDEHVWTSPVKAEEIVEKMTAKLMELDPANADFYHENSEEYIAELEKLDEKFEGVVEGANRKTILFGDRFPFRYLAEEYGLDYYAAFTGCSTDTEASASTVAFLIDKTNELKLPAVFSIELSNEKIVDSIVESSEAEKLTLHSVHNLSVEEFENGETYISLMEKNVENLAKALQ